MDALVHSLETTANSNGDATTRSWPLCGSAVPVFKAAVECTLRRFMPRMHENHMQRVFDERTCNADGSDSFVLQQTAFQDSKG